MKTKLYLLNILCAIAFVWPLSAATFSDAQWSPVGSGLSFYVDALAVSGNNLYAGGYFPLTGPNAVGSVAQWNGANWSLIDSQSNNDFVLALAATNNTLYVGGEGEYGEFLQQWTGSSWTNLSVKIVGSAVNALFVSGNTLFVGGDLGGVGIGQAGGVVTVANVARLIGTNWSALGSKTAGVFPPNPAYNPVETFAEFNGSLYVGGYFEYAGNSSTQEFTASNVARWDGTNWFALGSGLNGPIFALATLGSTLYAGGQFTMAGGVAASNIAQWDGTNWSALGAGVSGSSGIGIEEFGPYVNNLIVVGSNLYVGGNFTAAGNGPANNIALWDGTNWWPLGSGLNASVAGMAVSGNTLYVGGYFTTAGGKPASYIAMANLAPVVIITNDSMFGFNNGVFGFNFSGPPGSNAVIQASTDLQTWVPLQTNLLGTSPVYFSDFQSSTHSSRYYRAQLGP